MLKPIQYNAQTMSNISGTALIRITQDDILMFISPNSLLILGHWARDCRGGGRDGGRDRRRYCQLPIDVFLSMFGQEEYPNSSTEDWRQNFDRCAISACAA